MKHCVENEGFVMLYVRFIGPLHHGSLAQSCMGEQSKAVAALCLVSAATLSTASGKAEELTWCVGEYLQCSVLQ